jgi:hypothetical protein
LEEDEEDEELSTYSDDSGSSFTTTSTSTCSSSSSTFYVHDYFFSIQRPRLLTLMCQQLIATFTVTPTLLLYRTLMHGLSNSSSSARRTHLLSILSTISTTSPRTLSAALCIYAYEDKPFPILASHAHLLHAQDHPALVLTAHVVCTSARHPVREKGLELIRRELDDAARAIRTAVHVCFPKFLV